MTEMTRETAITERGPANGARFEGLEVRLRNGSARRYVVGVDVALGFGRAVTAGDDRDELDAGDPEDQEARDDEDTQAGDDLAADEADHTDRAPALRVRPTGTRVPARRAGLAGGTGARALAGGIGTRALAARPAAKPRAAAPRVALADVQPGKTNHSVLVVQRALAKAVKLDYASGPSHFGPATKAAYARWERKCGVAANGTPDLRSLTKLGKQYGFTVRRGSPAPSRGRMPGATWRPIPINFTRGGQEAVRGVVIHIMDGTLSGTDTWFRNPKAKASAHFGTSKDGKLYQWVHTKDRAWAQGAGNRSWLSVENEGRGGAALTPKQIDRCARILVWAHKVYGVPLQVAKGPGGRGLGHHSMGGPSWGHAACPGPRIIRQKAKIVERARQLARASAGRAGSALPRAAPRAADLVH